MHGQNSRATIATAPRQFTRRRLLQSASGALAGALLPCNVRHALAQQPTRRGSLADIKHVVLLMQENRSFDHYFGTLAGVRGFDDPEALKLPDGRPVFYQPDPQNPAGYLLPVHLDTRTTNAQRIPTTDHAWETQHLAWNGGAMDQWVVAHRDTDGDNGPFTMGYYTRADIPFHFALADAFTICDAFHCSVMGPTGPNRLHWMTGTIDPGGRNGGPAISNEVPPRGYRWTTYAERLQKAGVTWRVYQQPTSGGMGMLDAFHQFKNAPKDSPLRAKGLAREAEGRFEHDALNDRLPTVSWIIPTLAQCEHPDAMPAAGAAFIASKIDAIAANPEVWAKTAFILNYDENDGLFDHIAPPVPPPGTADEFVQGLPIGAGFRVPCIIVSSWTAGGFVCSEPFDHTSVLRFLELVTGVREDNISAWRRQTFGDLTSAFRFDGDKAVPPSLPDTNGLLEAARFEGTRSPSPVPPAGDQRMPKQERGERRRV